MPNYNTQVLLSKIEQKKKTLIGLLEQEAPDLLTSFSLESGVNMLLQLPDIYGYSNLGQDLYAMIENILNKYGERGSDIFCHLLALFCANRSLLCLDQSRLQIPLKSLYLKWLNKILGDLSLKMNEPLHKSNLFLKYLAVCNMRCIPVGGAWITELSGVSRRILFSGGTLQFLKTAFFFPLKTKGFRLFYQIHMVQNMKHLVTDQGRSECYKGVALLLNNSPDIKGMFACSWYYDPVVKEISPHLSYLSESAVRSGAQVYKIGSSQSDINNATQRSSKRRILYKEGKYLPTNHMLIWSRKNLLEWASISEKIDVFNFSEH